MPELPEVETIVRELAGPLPGRRILDARVLRPDLLDLAPGEFEDTLRDRRIEAVERRGKNVVLFLSGSLVLRVNLGMTGRLLFVHGPPGPATSSHLGVKLLLGPAGALLYDDVRRFGRIHLLTLPEWRRASDRLGPEPLDPSLTPAAFRALLAPSRSPLRSWLLDQSHVAGVGNIYANEALFLARLHPARPAGTLKPDEARTLLAGLRTVLEEAIEARGTTLRDYRTASGQEGGYGRDLRVYGREGGPCIRCKSPVRRIVFGNRSAFFCPRCQPEAP
jgi:formamidopyrimidine-DNA glycosylase